MTSAIAKLMAFLKRDLRSFIGTSMPTGTTDRAPGDEAARESPTAASPTKSGLDTLGTTQSAPLPMQLDPSALERVLHRRQVLDWRDASIQQVILEADMAFDAFSVHVAKLMKSTPLWRKVVPKPADQVLAGEFSRLVRAPIHLSILRCEHALDAVARTSASEARSRLHSFDAGTDLPLKCIAKYRFWRPSHAHILRALSLLVHGERGILDEFHRRIRVVSTSLIKEA